MTWNGTGAISLTGAPLPSSKEAGRRRARSSSAPGPELLVRGKPKGVREPSFGKLHQDFRRTMKEDPEKGVAIYHVVYAHEKFEKAAKMLLKLVRKVQETNPGAPRLLYLDIEGHRNAAGGFDADMLELQNEFLMGFLMPFLTEATCPMIRLRNPKGQDNDVPHDLAIMKAPTSSSVH
jgi:hypothetical protein